MRIRTVLALFLVLPAAASGQDLDTAVSGLVRISGTRGGTSVRGSGFVVALDGDKATIVTASHVIQGVQQLEVIFAVDPAESFPAGALLGMESDNPRGLAVFQVLGALPTGVTKLGFETEVQPHLSETLFLSGFPYMKTMPLTLGRNFAGPSGNFLQLDGTVGEGFSGAPVLRKGNVVGVVTEEDLQITYAVKAMVVRDRVIGWGVKVVEKCEPGRERTEAGMIFVRICPGTFTMGAAENDRSADDDEKPAHQVTLSEFWIGKTEVTNEQFRRFRPKKGGDADLPASYYVTWADAKAACEHFGGRLPTEAEWEYAARAGSQTVWSFGNQEELLSAYAWYDEEYEPFYVKIEKQQQEYRKWLEGPKMGPPPALHIVADSAKSVATRMPNNWGLHDMHGNVWEWVADWYGAYPAEVQTDPTGPPTGKYRVVRGGSINSPRWELRSARRNGHEPSVWDGEIGFRCARSARP